jgi:GNAT superfamily N-acetyltransferase
MSASQVEFEPLDLRHATEQEYKCLGAFKNIIEKEVFPDDPLTPLEEQIQDWKNIPALIETHTYIGWDMAHTEVVAFCGLFIKNTGDNEHAANFSIEVLPPFRRQGLGRRMLHILLPIAREKRRSLLIAWVNDRVSASAKFLERINAQPGLTGNVNQLKVSEFDHSLMDGWLKQSENLDTEFEMGLWEDRFPEDRLVEFAALMEKLANDQPRDNLELEDEKFTPDFLRQIQQNMLAAGEKIWTHYILDRANQKLIGLTEVTWNPNRPMILNQGFTAVDASYRNKGLGRWLKATMMKKILEERPQVEFIRTRNANSNAPMLKINNEMGFKPYSSMTIWQVKTAQVENYLNSKGENNP